MTQSEKRLIQFPTYLNDISDNSSGEYNGTRYIEEKTKCLFTLVIQEQSVLDLDGNGSNSW